MAKSALKPVSAFTNWQTAAAPDLKITPLEDLTIAHVCAAASKRQLVKTAIQGKYGGALPDTPKRVEMTAGVQVIWVGIDQWLLVAPRDNGRDLERELAPVLRGLAAVTDQTDARTVVRVSGRRANELLAKGVPIDLELRDFPANSAAVTHASHIGVVLWRIGSEPCFDLAVFRSFADSLQHWLHDSAESMKTGA